MNRNYSRENKSNCFSTVNIFINRFIIRLIFSLTIAASFYGNGFAQSPYKVDVTKESIIFGSGFIIAGITFTVNDDIQPLTIPEINMLNREDVNSFDRGATYKWSPAQATLSDLLVVSTILSPALFSFSDNVRNDFTPVLTMYFQTLMFSEVLPFLVKGLTQRVRPFVYNENAPLEDKKTKNAKRSYFSGHATAAFAMAVFTSTVYSDYYPNSKWTPYIWAGSLLMASAVGYLRYSSGSHFPTDIITGALVGSAIGYLIPFIHRTENDNMDISLGINRNGSFVNFHYGF